MTTKIKYIFINGDALEAEVDDTIAAYILLDRIQEESGNRKQRRIRERLLTRHKEPEWFASQWGNPEQHVISKEAYETLSQILDSLTEVQKRRLILRLSGISYSEIARQEHVGVQSVMDSVETIRKRLIVYLKYKMDE